MRERRKRSFEAFEDDENELVYFTQYDHQLMSNCDVVIALKRNEDGQFEFVESIPFPEYLENGGKLDSIDLVSGYNVWDYLDTENGYVDYMQCIEDNGLYEWDIEAAYIAGYEEKIEELGGWTLKNSIIARLDEKVIERLEDPNLTYGEIVAAKYAIYAIENIEDYGLDEETIQRVIQLNESIETKAREEFMAILSEKGIELITDEEELHKRGIYVSTKKYAEIGEVMVYDDEPNYYVGTDDESIDIGNEIWGKEFSYKEIMFSQENDDYLNAIRQMLGIKSKGEQQISENFEQPHTISEIAKICEETSLEEYQGAVIETKKATENEQQNLQEHSNE